MKKLFFVLLVLISATCYGQTPNYIYGKDVIIKTRDTSSAELTIINSTRDVLGFLKNTAGGKTTFKVLSISDITALGDSLLNHYTKSQSDILYPALSGSYSDPSWITSLSWSKITGTPTTKSGYGITDVLTYADTTGKWIVNQNGQTLGKQPGKIYLSDSIVTAGHLRSGNSYTGTSSVSTTQYRLGSYINAIQAGALTANRVIEWPDNSGTVILSTDTAAMLTGKVPYYGATSDIYIGSHLLTADRIYASSGSDFPINGYFSGSALTRAGVIGTALYSPGIIGASLNGIGSIGRSVYGVGSVSMVGSGHGNNHIHDFGTQTPSMTTYYDYLLKSYIDTNGVFNGNVKASSITISGLTNRRIVFSTTGGQLKDTTGFTWQGNFLSIPGSMEANGDYYANGTGKGYYGQYMDIEDDVSNSISIIVNTNASGGGMALQGGSNLAKPTLSMFGYNGDSIANFSPTGMYFYKAINAGSNSLTAGAIYGTTGTLSSTLAVNGSTLHSGGSNAIFQVNGSAGATYIRSTGVETYITGSAGYIGTFDNYSYNFITNNLVRATIDNSGNFGINTTSPGAPLDVNGNLFVRSTLAANTIDTYSGTTITMNQNVTLGSHSLIADYVTSSGFISYSGTASLPNNTWVTIYTMPSTTPGQGVYNVYANYLDDTGGMAFLQVLNDRTYARTINGSNGTVEIQLSGKNLQIRQTYGSTLDVQWSILVQKLR